MSEPSVRKDRVAEATVSAVREKIPNLENAVLGREYFYHSLPLCVIDAVFSIGVLYRNAQKAVEAWCAVQYPNWPIARTLSENRRYTIGDFVRLTDGKQGLALTQTFFGGNRQRTSTRNGILKADATVRFAKALQEAGIEDFGDIRDPARADLAWRTVRIIPGQGSGLSFDYLQMLAGDDSL
jgi:hypothetical protein